ncbi:hypothetical protein ISN45_Aa01g024160 [Arabidopsis thaliana x Arabidopsis arenosa]|uniref:Transmembrane protein n=1 Tax=Arabidopsis thaliana x Arabidopsis arenosa TaxID=1240361 RepID=A0A8T2C1Y1_9BRAS|nr:hypothetical protein ISN45_Aa01g024160 [Arabidopsis thaliana x Arabidopsis arenosa]
MRSCVATIYTRRRKPEPLAMLSSDQITQRMSSGNEIMEEEEEEEENGAYSSTVHRLIIFTNGGAMGLLQVVTNQSSTNEADRRAIILCFLVITLIYTILRVCEVKLRNKPNISNFVGHVSHLFGALAALTLIYLISPTFALVAVSLWLVWFVAVMYVSFSELVFPEDDAADSPV